MAKSITDGADAMHGIARSLVITLTYSYDNN